MDALVSVFKRILKGGNAVIATLLCVVMITSVVPVPAIAYATESGFEGWFDGDERVESLAAGTVGDVELQARWTANAYKLTYLDAEGEDHSIDLAYGAEYVVDGMKLTMGAADATLPAPDKAPEAGYSRNGWAVRYDPNDPTPRFEIVQGQPVVYTIVY